MCELFGVSSKVKVELNDFLKELYSHSEQHPHGWGLALFNNGLASIEKEPIRAEHSYYLKERLRHKIVVKEAIAHIRHATKGNMHYENCHPFLKQDSSGRCWTLAHNGTMFHSPITEAYFYKQEGQTDSERILYYLVDQIDQQQEQLKRSLTEQERFKVIETAIANIVVGNKMNLLIFDGDYFYVHKDFGSLYYLEKEDTVYFSTKPLGKYLWKSVPLSVLQVWKEGELIYTGASHHYEYVDNPKDTEGLYLDFSAL